MQFFRYKFFKVLKSVFATTAAINKKINNKNLFSNILKKCP